jgi:hypothetical protein
VLLSILLIILGLRLLKFSWDIRRIRPIPCPILPSANLEKVSEILDKQIERLEGMEREVKQYLQRA